MGQKSFKVFTKFISKMHNFVELKESYTINISRFNNICCSNPLHNYTFLCIFDLKSNFEITLRKKVN